MQAIEKCYTSFTSEELKLKESVLAKVKGHVEETENKFTTIINSLKNSQREGAKIERLLKDKLDSIKSQPQKILLLGV